jgi:hypothetical protein
MTTSSTLVNDTVNDTTTKKNTAVYQKPQTSLFLDPKTIEGGPQSMAESNNGVFS